MLRFLLSEDTVSKWLSKEVAFQHVPLVSTKKERRFVVPCFFLSPSIPNCCTVNFLDSVVISNPGICFHHKWTRNSWGGKTGLFFPFSFSDSSEVRTEVKMRSNDSLLLESIREQGKRGKGLCASSPSNIIIMGNGFQIFSICFLLLCTDLFFHVVNLSRFRPLSASLYSSLGN